ncbi:MAG TPA: glycosyltransferase, partial [Candidatus Saccharimonadales bacterium]
MKIGFFADQFLPGLDGVVVSMLNLADGLEELGHEVYFIVPRYPGYAPERHRVTTIPSLPVPLLGNTRIMAPGYHHKKKIQALNLDIVHSHNQLASGRLAVWAAKKLNVPHVTSIHTIFPEAINYYPKLSRVAKPLIQANMEPLLRSVDLKAYKPLPTVSGQHSAITDLAWRYIGGFSDLSDTVAVPSDHFGKKLKKLGVKNPVVTISNSVQLAEFSPKAKAGASRPMQVAAVGRLSPEKRQDVLIEAFAKLPPDTARLDIIGKGPEESRYKHLASQLAPEADIRFRGEMPPAKVRSMLADADAAVLASYGFETQGLVLLEYIASGLPVVYCDSNLVEAVGSSAGLLVKPDSASISGGLERLANNNAHRKKMSKAAIKQSRKFDHIEVAKRMLAVYQRLAR